MTNWKATSCPSISEQRPKWVKIAHLDSLPSPSQWGVWTWILTSSPTIERSQDGEWLGSHGSHGDPQWSPWLSIGTWSTLRQSNIATGNPLKVCDGFNGKTNCKLGILIIHDIYWYLPISTWYLLISIIIYLLFITHEHPWTFWIPFSIRNFSGWRNRG